MPLARGDLVGISLFGGPALPGISHHECADKGLDAGNIMEGIGAYGRGLIDLEELQKLECAGLPGSGTCSAMFTACTMSAVVEGMGMALPKTGSHPAATRDDPRSVTPQKLVDCEAVTDAIF